MKYTIRQQERIRQCELKLSGETQKAIWSIIREKGNERGKNIANKVGRVSEQVNNVIKHLMSLDMVERESRGIYKVSNYILTGVK
jgi:predicted transcriptional regulator